MFCMDFKDLRILATLSTLNVLNTLTDLKADSAPPPLPMLSSMILRKTTVPSMMFIRLSMYFFGPKAICFSPNSQMMMYVNTELIDA